MLNPDSTNINYQHIFNALHQAIIICNKEMQIIFANPDAQKLLEIHNELTGKSINHHSSFKEDYQSTLLPQIIDKGSFSGEIQITRADNSVINAFVTDSLLADNNAFNGIIRLIYYDNKEDITVLSFSKEIEKSKQAEEILLKKEKELKQLINEKDKFISIIADDLKNPFNAFLGLTEILAEDLHQLTLSEIQSISENLKESASNLYSILNNLLEWANIQNNQINYTPQSVSLKSIIDMSVEIAKESARQKDIHIELDIRTEYCVFADIKMTVNIIRNLISNAIRFTPPKGKIIISAVQYNNNFVKIGLEDNGIGLGKDITDNLFNTDFKPGHLLTKGKYGIGLDLLLCKEIIEKQGGNIIVESKPGKGSKYSFSLPIS